MNVKLLSQRELRAQLDDLRRVRRESVEAGDTAEMIAALDFLIGETCGLIDDPAAADVSLPTA